MWTGALRLDANDFDLRVLLAVAVSAVLVLLGLVRKAIDLLVLAVRNYGGRYLRALLYRGANLKAILAANHKNVGDLNVGLGLTHQLFDSQRVAFGYTVLLAARLNNCVHYYLQLPVSGNLYFAGNLRRRESILKNVSDARSLRRLYRGATKAPTIGVSVGIYHRQSRCVKAKFKG